MLDIKIKVIGQEPFGLFTMPAPISGPIVVNVNDDRWDADFTDGVPDVDLGTVGLQISLRAAIQYANATGGKQAITFDFARLPVGSVSGVVTIDLIGGIE